MNKLCQVWVLTSSLQTFRWTFSENNILTRIFGARYMRRFSAGAAAWILELNMVDIKCGFKNLHISIFPYFPTYHLHHLLQQQDFVCQFFKRWNWKMYRNQVTPNFGKYSHLFLFFLKYVSSSENNIYLPVFVANEPNLCLEYTLLGYFLCDGGWLEIKYVWWYIEWWS